jgi:hypothetical protein
MNDISPFIPGARVAIVQNNGFNIPTGYRLGIIAKVHKTGNFVLEGSTQQWKPYRPSGYEKYWNAVSTAQSRGRLRIWNEENHQEIETTIENANRAIRFTTACNALDRIAYSDRVTEEMVQQLEVIVTALKPPIKEQP